MIANTFQDVHHVVEYSMLAVGALDGLMINVAPVAFPARSVTMNVCVPVRLYMSQLLYQLPSIVAHDRLRSSKVMITCPV